MRISTVGNCSLSIEIYRQLKKKRVSEKAILQDFECWKKARREANRRR